MLKTKILEINFYYNINLLNYNVKTKIIDLYNLAIPTYCAVIIILYYLNIYIIVVY